MEKVRLYIRKITFSRKSGKTYVTLVDKSGKTIGKIVLSKEYPIYDAKEVVFFDGE